MPSKMAKIIKKKKTKCTVNKFKVEPIENGIKSEAEAPSKPIAVDSTDSTERPSKEAKTSKKKRPFVKKGKGKTKPEKTSFYMKCVKARAEKGMTSMMLPAKIESKIYKLKKALQKKGLPGEEVRDIIRKKRREEELKMRDELKHLCFKCRKPGHQLADCPLASQEASDICYFCGSAEHRLHECIKYKMSGKDDTKLPYAKCFICNKTGHLTRSCTKNENGVFPKGGKCILCGSVNHMVKDCSSNKDKDRPEVEVSLKTYGDVSASIDADDFTFTLPSKGSKASKGTKMVKF